MTTLTKELTQGVFKLTAAVIVFSGSVSAQESKRMADDFDSSRAERESAPSPMVWDSGALDLGMRLGTDPETGRWSEAASPVSARTALLSGLDVFGDRDEATEAEGEAEGDDSDPQASGSKDAWGIERNFGLAFGDIMLAELVVWMGHEYIRKGDISQVNPDSWWTNFWKGFTWDDNDFGTNMWLHPVQGAVYYNAARSNGYNYWESLPFTFFGSIHWECCGETHRMSINDWINTSIGGAAVGELFYRLSSVILDNKAEGSDRAWREAGALAVNPMRGVNRLFTGRAFREGENPTDPLDHKGNRISNLLSFGYRVVGEGDRLKFSESESHGFVEMDMIFGRPFDLERNKPFDWFALAAQLNFREKKPLGRLQIRANLYSFAQSETENSQKLWAITHYFDYVNNNAYEFGGQSIGLAYGKNWVRSERTNIVASADVHAMLMGGVNTEYAEFAEIEGVRERDREYDFGSGFGTWWRFSVLRDQYRIVELSYRFNWMRTLNGTNVGGQNTDHLIQQFSAKFKWPLTDTWGLGAESTIFLRRSYFQEADFGNVKQRNPEVRIQASWLVGTRGVN